MPIKNQQVVDYYKNKADNAYDKGWNSYTSGDTAGAKRATPIVQENRTKQIKEENAQEDSSRPAMSRKW